MTVVRNIAGLALIAGHLAARAIAGPAQRRLSLGDRLAMLPTSDVPVGRPVAIHWNDNQVPFIEAESDRDLAVGLGVVHAHLRLAQMEVMRRLATGRVAEMIGPVALDIDHLLRIVDFGRAVPAIVNGLPDETREWLGGFVDGINHYVERARRLPHEFAVLGLRREAWTVADVLTVGRLVAADVNWIVWFQLLRLRGGKAWPDLWRRLVDGGIAPFPRPPDTSPDLNGLARTLGASARWASNSVAVSASRSASGGALIASDPHLGLFLPGPFVIAGYRSPSHHAVGLMPPGLPFIAIGRNPWIAWGGTNLHAASSDFFDVSVLPQADVIERRETIKVRWWPDREVVLRDTPLGPVISDARILGLDRDRPIALRWIGHDPSDEVTAMLRLGRARGWDQFRAAIDGVAVSGQNLTFADAEGRVGRAMAARLPVRPDTRPGDAVLAPQAAVHWRRFVGASDLPSEIAPAAGVVVSANARPPHTAVPVGFFFSPDDRARRLSELLAGRARIGTDDFRSMLNDVYGSTAHLLCRTFVRSLEDGGGGRSDRRVRRLKRVLEEWDGRYEADSRGALAFELVFFHFVDGFYGDDARRAYLATWDPAQRVLEDVRQSDAGTVAAMLRRALRRSVRGFERYRCWGRMHRLRLRHPFGFIPVVGRRYLVHDAPSDGGNGTVYATGHRSSGRRHAAIFGSCARHVSDLSDPDANFFVLLGGQDGWIGSATMSDQLALWRQDRSLQLPLSPPAVRALYRHRTELLPC